MYTPCVLVVFVVWEHVQAGGILTLTPQSPWDKLSLLFVDCARVSGQVAEQRCLSYLRKWYLVLYFGLSTVSCISFALLL